MYRPLASRGISHAARLSVLVFVLGAAFALPGVASAATNPGVVELFQSSLNYTARDGQANDVSVNFEPDQVTLTDTAASLSAGAGCRPGSSVHEVLCTTDDVGTSTFSFLQYVIDTGDLADSVSVTTAPADTGPSFFIAGTLRGGSGDDSLTGGDGSDVLIGGTGADVLSGGGGEADTVAYTDHPLGVTATIGTASGNGNGSDGAGDTIASDVENLSGGPAADTLTGDGARNGIFGAGGADVLNGAGGSDTLCGADGFVFGASFDETDPAQTADGADMMIGATGADSFSGDAGADTFIGGAGIDTADYSDHFTSGVTATVGATGGNADDGAGDTITADVENITGSSGNDTLNGDGGSNRLDGGQGTDTLNGNAGADALDGGYESFAGAGAPDMINGGDGNDVFFAGSDFPGSTPDGADTFNGGPGIDRADYSSRDATVTVTLNDDVANDGAAGEHDHIAPDVENATGGAAGDTLTGNGVANVLRGGFGTGADIIKGGAGDDTLYGGYGFNDGIDSLEGETGDDTLFARDNTADLLVDCGPGVDSVDGDTSPDDNALGCETTVAPGPGTAPTGQVAANFIGVSYTANPGVANDVTATFSADQVVVTDTAAAALTAGPGCQLTDATTVRCSLDDSGFASSNYAINTGDGNDKAEIVNGANGFGVLEGDAGNDQLTGGDGEDSVVGGPGADTLAGGEGSDTADYGDHTAPLTATIGAGATSGEDGAGDSIAADFENLSGGSGADTLTGDAGTNRLIGAQGADVLHGLGGSDDLDGAGFAADLAATDGADVLDGGTGNDRLSGGIGGDTFTGGSGSDTADYGDHGAATFAFDGTNFVFSPGPPVTVTLGAGDGDDGNSEDGAAGSRDTVGLDVENVSGTPSGDTLTGSPGANHMDGQAGADTIVGLAGNDVLQGGSDQVADVLDGGDGADTYVAEGFHDFQLSPSSTQPDGADTFAGGAGIDKVDYSSRTAPLTVTLDGAADDGQSGENDDIAADVENVTGGSAADTITGNDAPNRLHGGPGAADDTLDGAGGNDRIIGGNGIFAGGNLTDGDGADTLRGGSGQDTISSIDGRADTVDCGDGVDFANVDDGGQQFDGVLDAITGCENVNPTGFSQAVSAGGTVTSDSQPGETPGVSATDPVDVAITSPNGGNVTVAESEVVSGQPPADSEFLALQVNITAPDATLQAPLRLVFTIDASLVPAAGADAIRVFRDGAALDDGCPTDTTASDAGCVLRPRETSPDGDVTLTILTAHASAWNFAVPAAVVDPGTAPVPVPVPVPAAVPSTKPVSPPAAQRLAAKLAAPRFKRRKGTKLTLDVAVAGKVTVVMQRLGKGHKKGSTCSRSAKHGKSCSVTLQRKTITLSAKPGGAAVSFGKGLKKGAWTATLTIAGAKPATVKFTVT